MHTTTNSTTRRSLLISTHWDLDIDIDIDWAILFTLRFHLTLPPESWSWQEGRGMHIYMHPSIPTTNSMQLYAKFMDIDIDTVTSTPLKSILTSIVPYFILYPRGSWSWSWSGVRRKGRGGGRKGQAFVHFHGWLHQPKLIDTDILTLTLILNDCAVYIFDLSDLRKLKLQLMNLITPINCNPEDQEGTIHVPPPPASQLDPLFTNHFKPFIVFFPSIFFLLLLHCPQTRSLSPFAISIAYPYLCREIVGRDLKA